MEPYTPLKSAYTSNQIIAWLKHIRLPPSYTKYISNPTSFPKTYEALQALMRCQISQFTYDNLTVHYSSTHLVDINPQVLYEKFLGPSSANKHGGYCMELNIFFHHMICGLGFRGYITAVRNRSRINGVPGGEFRGFTHITNIVYLPTGQKYCMDVAFGGDGSINPLLMDGSGRAVQNLGAQQVRLVHDTISKQRFHEPSKKLWIYQYRNGPMKEWNSFYCFSEIEWFQEDFEVLNLWGSVKPPHTLNVWAVRFIREGDAAKFEDCESDHLDVKGIEDKLDGEVKIVGKVMLVDNVIKLNMGGKTRVIHEFETEEGRLKALKEYFAMTFTDEEAQSIKGRATALQ